MMDGRVTISFSTSGLLLLIGLALVFIPAPGKSQVRKCLHEGTFDISKSGHRSADQDAGDALYVPVVIHIVYSNAEQNISEEKIYSQLEVINEDFNRMNGDSSNTITEFKSLTGIANIHFYLPDDEIDEPVTRTLTSHGPFHNDDLHLSSTGGRDAIESNRYLNIWVADLAPGLLGYAAAPGTEAFKDGVTIHYQYFGKNAVDASPFNKGRTLTHEIAHWLGLQHLWGTGGCDSDDGIADTPRQDGPVGSCDVTYRSCNALGMVQNFMNLADDGCMNFFTKGQTAFMRNTLLTERKSAFRDKVITSVADQIRSDILPAYPNPVTHQPKLSIETFLPTHIVLDDVCGKRILEKYSGHNERVELDLGTLGNGIYLLHQDNRLKRYSQKIILDIQ